MCRKTLSQKAKLKDTEMLQQEPEDILVGLPRLSTSSPILEMRNWDQRVMVVSGPALG